MNTHFEDLILLRSTGELPTEQMAELEAAIASDPHLAQFAQKIALAASLSARAPRDFAAEAIAQSHSAMAPADYAARAIRSTHRPLGSPWLWSAAAAAAAVILLGSVAFFLQPDSSVPMQRRTVAISERLDAIEQSLSAPITPRSRARQHRSI